MADGLQDPQHPAYRPVAAADQHPEVRHLLEGVEAEQRNREDQREEGSWDGMKASGDVRVRPVIGRLCSPCVAGSPSQRSPVGNVEDLMRAEKFAEAVEELPALQTAALRVDEHQQGADVFPELVDLRDDGHRQ